jgi:hypothetical protein
VAGDDAGEATDNSSENFIFSLYLFETLTYRGLIRFKYFCITSFENRSAFESSEGWSCILLSVFLKLFPLVNSEFFGASSTLSFTVKKALLSCLLCSWLPMETDLDSVFAVAIDFDFGFLNMST